MMISRFVVIKKRIVFPFFSNMYFFYFFDVCLILLFFKFLDFFSFCCFFG